MNQETPLEILMIDDDPDDFEITQMSFEEGGLHANLHHCYDGVQGLKYLRGEGEFEDSVRPDVVLLDLNMPHLDGHETLAEIRKDPELTDLPVVVMTTSGSAGDVAKAYTAHANLYIQKPVDLDQFIEAVQSMGNLLARVVMLPRRRD